MRWRLNVLMGCVVLFGTCAFSPGEDAQPWTPPEHYREIWDSAQACTGKHGDYDRITWLRFEGRAFECRKKGGPTAIGCWAGPHTIIIASDWANIDWVPKHEMIHDLTGLTHDGGDRDRLIWGKRCHAMWGWLDTDSTYRP